MALSLLFKGRKNKIGSLTIEATVSETHNFSSTPTKFPIESGSMVSDHIINEPEKVRIDGVISDTPLNASPSNYAQQAFDSLYTMWKSKELVIAVTQFKVYTDMCITDISVPRTAKSGQAIQFSIELCKITKVNSSNTNAGVLAGTVADQASQTVSVGQVSTTPATTTETTLTQRIIQSVQGFISGLFL